MVSITLIILSSTPSSFPLWAKGLVQKEKDQEQDSKEIAPQIM
jgi:hypothetical protein